MATQNASEPTANSSQDMQANGLSQSQQTQFHTQSLHQPQQQSQEQNPSSSSNTSNTSSSPKVMSLTMLFERIGADDFYDLVVQYLRQHPETAQDVALYITKVLDRRQLEKAEREIDVMYGVDEAHRPANGKRPFIRWEDVGDHSWEFFVKGRQFLAGGYGNMALAVGLRWLELFNKYFEEEKVFLMEEDGYGLVKACQGCVKFLQEALSSQKLSEHDKADALERIGAIANDGSNVFERSRRGLPSIKPLLEL